MDVPSVKSGDTVSLVLLVDWFLVESLVVWVFKLWLQLSALLVRYGDKGSIHYRDPRILLEPFHFR